MDEAARFDALLEVLEELAEANETVPILVEGKRDVTSLRLLDCRGVIEPINQGAPLFNLCETLATKTRQVILMTDWDRKGGVLYETLQSSLTACGVRVDGTFRDKIQFWMRPPVKDVESLASYVGKGLARFYETTLEERAEARE
jgi:5S rRNA maturation endonuclease (ribonuclease M5)